ncbi:hypothetical protein BS50DRAFT_582215 [Corynespora cassiicola Philippines]|uniref:Uncharacterized protein n=1 Tax=Corynespora cassiicola Philippines TaxID=1448308 RepID=A0A2T2PD02_CORCC|nr:hypothetical protein BS50DRAFT_582215 [Corynespora cassiicola Philippines]
MGASRNVRRRNSNTATPRGDDWIYSRREPPNNRYGSRSLAHRSNSYSDARQQNTTIVPSSSFNFKPPSSTFEFRKPALPKSSKNYGVPSSRGFALSHEPSFKPSSTILPSRYSGRGYNHEDTRSLPTQIFDGKPSFPNHPRQGPSKDIELQQIDARIKPGAIVHGGLWQHWNRPMPKPDPTGDYKSAKGFQISQHGNVGYFENRFGIVTGILYDKTGDPKAIVCHSYTFNQKGNAKFEHNVRVNFVRLMAPRQDWDPYLLPDCPLTQTLWVDSTECNFQPATGAGICMMGVAIPIKMLRFKGIITADSLALFQKQRQAYLKLATLSMERREKVELEEMNWMRPWMNRDIDCFVKDDNLEGNKHPLWRQKLIRETETQLKDLTDMYQKTLLALLDLRKNVEMSEKSYLNKTRVKASPQFKVPKSPATAGVKRQACPSDDDREHPSKKQKQPNQSTQMPPHEPKTIIAEKEDEEMEEGEIKEV